MRRRGNRGHTLVEVLTAATLMGLLLAIGIPRFTRVRAPYVMAGATRQIAGDLQATRQRAIARNVSYRLNFNTANNTYIVERLQGVAWVTEGARQRLPAGARIGTLAPGNPVFDTRGLLAADVTIPLLVTGAQNKSVRINVLGKTTIS